MDDDNELEKEKSIIRTFWFYSNNPDYDKIFDIMSSHSKNVYNISIFVQNFFIKVKKFVYNFIFNNIDNHLKKIKIFDDLNKIIIDTFENLYTSFANSYNDYKNNHEIIYDAVCKFSDGIILNNKNYFPIRQLVLQFVKLNKKLYKPENSIASLIFCDDIVDEILQTRYNKTYFQTKYQAKNRIPITIKDNELINNVLSNNYLFDNSNVINFKNKISETVMDKLKLKKSIITSDQNIIGRIIYQNLGDNKGKLPSDVINRIITKATENFSSFWSLKSKGRKPGKPQFLKKNDKFVIPYLTKKGMYEVNDNEYKIFLGEYINQHYCDFVDDIVLVSYNKKHSKYTEKDNVKNMNNGQIKGFIKNNPNLIIDGGFMNIEIPKKLCKYEENNEYNPKNIYYKEIKMIEIVPINDKYKICVKYVPLTKETTKEEEILVDNMISIDLGMDNLMAFYDPTGEQYLIKGNKIVSINNYFNKQISKYQSELKKTNKKHTSKRLTNLFKRRNDVINGYFDKLVEWLYFYYEKKKLIIIGKNINWKHKLDLGNNTRNFYQIPFNKLINKIKNKGQKKGIKVVIQEESYTSICDAYGLEEVGPKNKYEGERVTRGLFRSENGEIINADLNGAINIMRKYCKAKGKDFLEVKGKKIFNPTKIQLDKKCL